MNFVCLVTAVLVGGFFSAQAAHAQSNEAPLLNDIPQKQTLPADGVFDVRGVALGAKASEVLAAFKQIAPNSQPQIPRGTTGIGDNRGNSVNFEYQPQMSINVDNSDGSSESFEAIFTTRINESRAVRVTRRISYSNATQQASLPAFLESLTQKYGQSSYTELRGQSMEIYYVWFDGKRASLNQQTYSSQRYSRGTPASCTYMSEVGNYGFSGNRQDQHPGCSAGIFVSIDFGTRNDLIRNLKIEMVDKMRFLKSAMETDAYLQQELNKKISGQSGAAAPKL